MAAKSGILAALAFTKNTVLPILPNAPRGPLALRCLSSITLSSSTISRLTINVGQEPMAPVILVSKPNSCAPLKN